MKKLLLVIAMSFSILCVSANVFEHESDIEKISNELPALENVKCKFRQEKQIGNMVLKSAGDFEFDKTKGVIFYTKEPVQTTVSYTSREYRRINDVITAISNKSFSRIKKDFQFYFTKDGVWAIGLLPKQDSPAFGYLKSIEIQGEKDIKKIVILSCDKTKTIIWFD